MPPQINIARHGGFCFGVKLAVNAALKASQEHQNVVMLGDIVHNEHVVRKIDDAGVKVVSDLAEVSKGTLLLRAHGSTPQVYEDAKKLNFNIIDATCPLVLEIHEIVRELDKEGYQICVIGDHGHDEVVGISSQVKNALVISKPEEVAQAVPRRIKKLGVVTQSTQNIDNVKKVIAELTARVGELKFVDTICGPTKAYQREIRHLPLENDVMVIVGSFKSANTCRLTEISRSLNPRSFQVESPLDVKPEWFEEAKTIGVSAGASTPDWIIQQVVDRVRELTRSEELVERGTQV